MHEPLGAGFLAMVVLKGPVQAGNFYIPIDTFSDVYRGRLDWLERSASVPDADRRRCTRRMLDLGGGPAS
jgi:hypothetical protein